MYVMVCSAMLWDLKNRLRIQKRSKHFILNYFQKTPGVSLNCIVDIFSLKGIIKNWVAIMLYDMLWYDMILYMIWRIRIQWYAVKLYDMVEQSNAMVWHFNAIVWYSNSMLCYGVSSESYACNDWRNKKKNININILTSFLGTLHHCYFNIIR